MKTTTLEDDLVNMDFECCTSGQAAFVDSLHEIESTSKGKGAITSKNPSARTRRPSRMPFGLRNSSKNLMSNFTKSLTVSASEAADLVSAEYFAEGSSEENESFDELFTKPSLLDEDEEEHSSSDGQKNSGIATTNLELHLSLSASHEGSLAQEVGNEAHEYLEECFYTEVSILDRKKFDAIPEIVKSDLTIKVREL